MLLDLEERNFEFQRKRIKFIQEFTGGFDDRDRLYFKDILKKSSDPGYRAIEDTPDPRGREISIQLVCQELGINPGGKNAQIGKEMAKRWRAKYPGQKIPKRDTLYHGRPYKENVYYQRDYSMMEKVIREVLK